MYATHKYYNLHPIALCRNNFVRIPEHNLFDEKTFREVFHDTRAKQNKSIINNKRRWKHILNEMELKERK